jgi:putative iron-dependent peroxidase
MATAYPQSGILLPVPPVARHLELTLRPEATRAAAAAALQALGDPLLRVNGTSSVVGVGPGLARLLDVPVPGLRPFPPLSGDGVEVPSTQKSLWIWLRGEDRGELVHRTRAIAGVLASAFSMDSVVDAFVYDIGRDLTGYEDGTENPKAEAATDAAIVSDAALAPEGSSFVAVQIWQHDLARFFAMSKQEQDNIVGRERDSNEEMEEAPAFSHVKRTAQESFDPVAFVVRRSMPWTEGPRSGLVFVAFGDTLDSYENQLKRMVGLDDGIVDGMFRFSTPLSGAYYWCPPVVDGRVRFGAA